MACLRPEFTRVLAESLHTGACINLISPHGQGRRRTLADLRHCLPASMSVLLANMRDHPRNPAAMLAGLAAQAGRDAPDGLETLLDRLTGRSERTLIILHNLDEMQQDETGGYGEDFLAALATVRVRAGIALLCVSERPPQAWPLDLEMLTLPPLNEEQILAELARRDAPVRREDWPRIARWLAGQPAPYSLLARPDTWPARRC